MRYIKKYPEAAEEDDQTGQYGEDCDESKTVKIQLILLVVFIGAGGFRFIRRPPVSLC